jgi:predicted dehydrogenase
VTKTVANPRAAIVGAGWIADHGHLPAYAAAGVEVAAIADIDEAVASALAERHGVPRVDSDWRQMLAEVQPDIVSVCVPNMWHAEIALGAIEAGAHVFCEKPLATSLDEAERMFAAARAADVVLMADQNTRFQPRNRVLREAIDRGDLGEIYFVETVYARRMGIPGWGSFTSRAHSFGGAVCDIGVHALDLAVSLLGNPRPRSVSATTATEFGTREDVAELRGRHWEPSAFDVEDFGAAFVRFEQPSGREASLVMRASWAAHIEGNEEWIQLQGTDGGLRNDPPVRYRHDGGEPLTEPLEAPPHGPGWNEAVAHFVDCVRGDASPLVTPEETLNVQRILNGIYDSAASGHEVRFD